MRVSTKTSFSRTFRTSALVAGFALGFTGATLATEGSTAANGFFTKTKRGTCSNNVCEALFDAVPVGQNFLVTQASCRGIGTGSNGVLALTLSVKDGDVIVGPTTNLIPVGTGSFSSSKVFVANDRVLHVLKGGQTLRALFVTADSPALEIECTIAGQFLKG
jgi:hypothetical protein